MIGTTIHRFFVTASKVIAVTFLCCVVATANAQTTAATQPKAHRWAVYGGIGPNYYFNNLEVAQTKVTELNYSFVARLMWEPEFFLSLGFETGYNRLYSLSADNPNTGTVSIVNAAVPIQLVVSMKFSKYLYGSFNMGQSILYNNVSTSKLGNFDASVVSLGDFAASFGYKRPVSDRFLIGAELKGYYSGKLDDKNIALVFMGGYRLW